MDVPDRLEPEDLSRWGRSGELDWLERLQAVNPRFHVELRPETEGLAINVRPSDTGIWREVLAWPVTLGDAVAMVEVFDRDDQMIQASYRWFKDWITASMAESRPGANPTTACMAFGFVLNSLEADFIDHSLAVIDNRGNRVVPPHHEPLPDDKSNAWTHRFHADGLLDVIVGQPADHHLAVRRLTWVAGDAVGGQVTLYTWLTPFRYLKPALTGEF